MHKVATYCRVSTSKEDQLNSFERQQQMYNEEIKMHPDWELYRAYSDRGLSGTDVSNRPGFLAMKEAGLNGEYDILITREVSRLSRNILQFYEFTRAFEKKGIVIYFIDDDLKSSDDGFETIAARLISFAQEESKKTSKRVKRGQSIAMENGSVFGNSLLGYDLRGGKLYINPDGAETVARIFDMYVNRGMGLRRIKKALESEGVPTMKNHKHWTLKTILTILRNEKYCGDLIQGKTVTPNYLEHRLKVKNSPEKMTVIQNHHEPIISRDLWLAAQKHPAEGSVGCRNRHIMSGKIFCGQCGKSFSARTRKNRDGSTTRVWRCRTAVSDGVSACPNGKQLRDDAAMHILKEALSCVKLDEEYIIKNMLFIMKKVLKSAVDRDPLNTEFYEKELTALRAQQMKILENELAGAYPQSVIQEKLKQLEQRKKKITEKIRGLQSQDGLSHTYEELERAAKKHIEGLLSLKNPSAEYLRARLKGITIFPGRTAAAELEDICGIWKFELF